ncbi:MAG TPA: hypothetical protein VM638_05480 [Actinomycetota bacterium]|nr:hypothetical protein [Actinomycetota bacterium]
MRASDLLHTELRDPHTGRPTQIRDLRLERMEGKTIRLRLTEVVLGGGALAERFGYGRGPVRGPWLVKVVLDRLRRRHTDTVAWREVLEVRGEKVKVRRKLLNEGDES